MKGLNHELGLVGWRDEVSIGVTDRVVTGLAVADVARWRLDSSAGTELCDPQQVVGGADQVGGETGPFDAPIARATEVADVLIQPKISSTRLRTRWLTA